MVGLVGFKGVGGPMVGIQENMNPRRCGRRRSGGAIGRGERNGLVSKKK